ncbi:MULTISPECIES: FecR family protein [Olivibacter]|uniref:FecR family protein n=1 Tax=Olivibacter jilunii TaxID=985016 RepID=A0ABW6AZ35_9SPHI
MNKDAFYKELIHRYRAGSATEEELEAFYHLVQSGEIDHYLSEIMEDHFCGGRPKSRLSLNFGYAAAIVICFVSGFIFFYYQNHHHNRAIIQPPEEITAAKDQAILTLADGTKIKLDSTRSESENKDGFQVLSKLKAVIGYNKDATKEGEALVYHEIAIPNGGKFKVILSDGTKVWLNAGSKLKFPVRFSKARREVELDGEAYFEVESKISKQENQPFTVHTRYQDIQVLGTSFNIKAYQDEPSETSTLVTGRVNVINKRTRQILQLNPGKELTLSKAAAMTSVSDADIEEVLAWKHGDFVFNETPIYEIMKQLARWYDVEVDFGSVANNIYSGYIPRDANLKQVLDMMERTGELKFDMNNRKIYVKTKMPM